MVEEFKVCEIRKSYLALSQREEELGRAVVDCAYKVHKSLGPGLLERVYEICFCIELEKKGIVYKRQTDVPIVYDGITLNEYLRLDVLVEDTVICELKSAEYNPVWDAQLLSYLKIVNKRLGFLINFNVPYIREGIRRFIL